MRSSFSAVALNAKCEKQARQQGREHINPLTPGNYAGRRTQHAQFLGTERAKTVRMTRCTRVPTKNMRTSMDRSASHQQTPRLPHTCRGRGLASALGLIVTLWSLAAYSEGFRNP